MGYPFTPKSALKLQFGDTGQFGGRMICSAFLSFIGRWGNMRSGFTAALLDHVQPSPCLAPDGPPIHLRKPGHLHVKTFPETATEIIGNVCLGLNVAEVERALAEQRQKSIVWGYRVPVIKVNKLQANDA
jgi:hypothetical protein